MRFQMDITQIFNLNFYEYAYYNTDEGYYERRPLQYVASVKPSEQRLEIWTSGSYWRSERVVDENRIRVNPEKKIGFEKFVLDFFGHNTGCLILDYLSLEKILFKFRPTVFKILDTHHFCLDTLHFLSLIYHKYFIESELVRLSDPKWSPKNIRVRIHSADKKHQYSSFGTNFVKLWPLSFSFEYSHGEEELWNPETFQQTFRSRGWFGTKTCYLTVRFYHGYPYAYF